MNLGGPKVRPYGPKPGTRQKRCSIRLRKMLVDGASQYPDATILRWIVKRVRAKSPNSWRHGSQACPANCRIAGRLDPVHLNVPDKSIRDVEGESVQKDAMNSGGRTGPIEGIRLCDIVISDDPSFAEH
jgi:hypothetical protein